MLTNSVLKLSDSNITLNLNSCGKVDFKFDSIQSIVNHYKDSYSYQRKSSDKFITIENKPDNNDLSIYGEKIVQIVENSLYENDLRYTALYSLFFLIEYNISWERLNDKGKFIKRLKKLFHSTDSKIVKKDTYYNKNEYEDSDYIKYEIPEKTIQEINVLINSKIDEENNIYIFDISNEDYKAGLYSESYTSCMWNQYNDGRIHFLNSGGFSIRRHIKINNNLQPMGRVWGYIDDIKGIESLIIFNLYDESFDNLYKYCQLIVKLLSSLTGKDYIIQEKYITTPCDFRGNQVIWINYDKCAVISEKINGDFLKNQYSIDFNDDIFSTLENYDSYCESCGCGIDDSEAYYSEYNDCTYCEECYNRLHDNCCECGQIFHNNELTSVDNSYNMVCENCLNEYYFTCENCGDITHLDDCNYDENLDSNYCSYCYDELFEECEACHNSIDKDNLIRVKIGFNQYENYCPDCIESDENLSQCYLCGIYCDCLQLSKIDNKDYCINCEIRLGLNRK